MTLVLGLRSAGGVVLAADSQRTEGSFRQTIPKLFTAPAGIAWGTAGSINIQQELFVVMNELDLPLNPPLQRTKDAIARALPEAVRRATAGVEEPSPAATTVAGLFAWYSETDGRDFLLRVHGDGQRELHAKYTAIGAEPRRLALFALNSSEHLEYATLPLEAAKMVAFNIADQVIRDSSSGVGLPVQIAEVTRDGIGIVQADDLRALEDTVAAFRERQRDFLVRRDDASGPSRDTGLRP